MPKRSKRPKPLFPEPEPIRLKKPLVIKSSDALECQDPEDAATLKAWSQTELDRFNLVDRLRGYKVSLLSRLCPFTNLTEEMTWLEIEKLLPTIKLSKEAPGESRDALLAMKTLVILNHALIAVRELTPAMKVALCAAIDFGKLLQRGHDELMFAQLVDSGLKEVGSLAAASSGKRKTKELKSEEARGEFERRKALSPTSIDEHILINMVRKGRSLRTLMRYKKHWKNATPTE